MIDSIPAGLYRTTTPLPDHEEAVPAGALVFVGQRADGRRFVVRPGSNRKNRWFWAEPTLPLPASGWMWTLYALPREGFYTLPETIELDRGGRWLKGAIVQLGYNEAGRGIVFIAEQHEASDDNVLRFASRGRLVEDALLERLVWAPILPVSAPADGGAIDPEQAN
ncbi:MAG: hypothetical protein IT385_27045 [Deltaproteobacteria bacterium]|nr:hypothetical protein [Deltaproteobacteria bacterium]